jgi:hypothetical protein
VHHLLVGGKGFIRTAEEIEDACVAGAHMAIEWGSTTSRRCSLPRFAGALIAIERTRSCSSTTPRRAAVPPLPHPPRGASSRAS